MQLMYQKTQFLLVNTYITLQGSIQWGGGEASTPKKFQLQYKLL